MFIIGCTSKIDTNRDPDFQSLLIPSTDETDVWLAMVDDNMTPKERDMFNLPEEWEVYRIKIGNDTAFIDEDGLEVSKELFEEHDFEFKVWTKEPFKQAWSKVSIEDRLNVEHLPMYTAAQIQLVHITDEQYLARDFAKEEGEFALFVYMGEAFDDQQKSQFIQNEVLETVDLTNSPLKSVAFSSKPSERKEKLLGIVQYPIFVLYDHEKLIMKSTNIEDITEAYTKNN